MTSFSRFAAAGATLALAGATLIAAPAAYADGDSAPGSSNTVFTYTGSEQTYTVPEGITHLNMVVAGGGGSGGSSDGGSVGGAGAVVKTELDVTPGDVLTIRVGGGASALPNQPSCIGGSATSVLKGSTTLAVAGGGGGSCGGKGGDGAQANTAAGGTGLDYDGDTKGGKGGDVNGGDGSGHSDGRGVGGTADSPTGGEGHPDNMAEVCCGGSGGGYQGGGDGGPITGYSGEGISASFTRVSTGWAGGGGAGFGGGGQGSGLTGGGGGGGYGGGGGAYRSGGGAGGSFATESGSNTSFAPGPVKVDDTNYAGGGARGMARDDRSGQDGVVAFLFAPAMEADPESLSFGDQSVDIASSAKSVTVTNTGNADLEFGAQPGSIVWDMSSSYAITDDGCVNQTVEPGDTCVIKVTFTPSKEGRLTASLTIHAENVDDDLSVGLDGNGIPKGFTATPNPVDFGNVYVNHTSENKVVAVTNEGDDPLSITDTNITGTDANEFSVQRDDCRNLTLAKDETCTVTLSFTPTSEAAKTANLTFTDSGFGSPHNVALKGAGVYPKISISPPDLNFGPTRRGTSGELSSTITSSGSVPLTISDVQLSGTDAGQYSIIHNSCTEVLQPEATCEITARYTPTTLDSASATITVTSDAQPGSESLIALSGSGVEPALMVDPSSLTFDPTPVGTETQSQDITLTNTGNDALTLDDPEITGAAKADYAITHTTCVGNPSIVLSPDSSCTVSVAFTPSGPGSRKATVQIGSNAPDSPAKVSLSGTGLAPAIAVQPSKVDFGEVLPGKTSPKKVVTVRNTGTLDLLFNAPNNTIRCRTNDARGCGIAATVITGNNANDFSIASNTCVQAVAPGKTCQIGVTFTAPNVSKRTAALVIASNAGDVTVPLTGTGLGKPSAPSSIKTKGNPKGNTFVTKWNPPASGGTVAKYEVRVQQTHVKGKVMVLDKFVGSKSRQLTLTRKQLLAHSLLKRGDVRMALHYKVSVYAMNAAGESTKAANSSFVMKAQIKRK